MNSLKKELLKEFEPYFNFQPSLKPKLQSALDRIEAETIARVKEEVKKEAYNMAFEHMILFLDTLALNEKL